VNHLNLNIYRQFTDPSFFNRSRIQSWATRQVNYHIDRFGKASRGFSDLSELSRAGQLATCYLPTAAPIYRNAGRAGCGSGSSFGRRRRSFASDAKNEPLRFCFGSRPCCAE